MSIIESLLLNITDTKEIKSSNSKGNFLTDLLKSFKDDPDKLSDIFKSLNLNEKDLDNISLKTDDTELKDLINKIKAALKKDTDKNVQFKTQNIKDSSFVSESKEKLSKKIQSGKQSDKIESDILKRLINETPISNDELKEKFEKMKKNESPDTKRSDQTILSILNVNPSKNEQNINDADDKTTENKVVSVIKKIITSTQTLQKMSLDDKEVKEFKEIKTFKELVDFANKKNLNISKIVISYDKSEKPAKTVPKNKIELKPKISLNNKISLKPHVSENKPTDILSSLIQQTKNHISTKQTIKTEPNIIENTNIINDIKPVKKEDNSSTNSNLNASQMALNSLKQNIHKAKQSISHFANNLKEAIDNYKPPISKLSMELHPKELGKVEVTLIHRGDNLQIQINSNNTAINFLHSSQQELRQNLINMGFTDVNMSFNQNQQQGSKHYKQNQKFANNSNEENDELIIEIPYQYA